MLLLTRFFSTIHMDILRPSRVTSFGFGYFVTFIVECSSSYPHSILGPIHLSPHTTTKWHCREEELSCHKNDTLPNVGYKYCYAYLGRFNSHCLCFNINSPFFCSWKSNSSLYYFSKISLYFLSLEGCLAIHFSGHNILLTLDTFYKGY